MLFEIYYKVDLARLYICLLGLSHYILCPCPYLATCRVRKVCDISKLALSEGPVHI